MELGHAHKTRLWYLLGVLSKFSDEDLRHVYRGVYPPPPRGSCLKDKVRNDHIMERKRLVSPGSVNTSIQCCLIETKKLVIC